MAEPHFDLLFETSAGSALAAWRSPVWPLLGTIAVQRLKDHRRAYLEYEGEISGGRGHVTRVAGGTFRLLQKTQDLLAVELDNDRRRLMFVRQATGENDWYGLPIR